MSTGKVVVAAIAVVAGTAAFCFAAPIAAFFGGLGILGSASTGTAIASLSGAALTSSSLAAVGGGSLAAGGAGMVGGTVVITGVGGTLGAGLGYTANKVASAKT